MILFLLLFVAFFDHISNYGILEEKSKIYQPIPSFLNFYSKDLKKLVDFFSRIESFIKVFNTIYGSYSMKIFEDVYFSFLLSLINKKVRLQCAKKFIEMLIAECTSLCH